MNIKDVVFIFARWIGTIIAGWLLKKGYDQSSVDTYTGAIVLGLATGVTAIIALMRAKGLWPTWLTDEKLIKAAEKVQQGKATVEDVPGKLTPTVPADPYIGHGNSGNTLIILMLLIPTLLLSNIACTASPAKQVTLINQTLTTTLQLVNDAKTQGLITQKQLTDAKPYIDATVGAARAATHAAVVGDANATQIYIRSFWAANDELLKWRARVLKRE